MDSFTQFALGAAIGGATLGPRAGRKAILWGGVCGTLPDLDIFVPLGDPVSDFTYHRGVSHAVFFLTLAAPAVAALIWRLHDDLCGDLRGCYSRVLWMVWLCLVTHPLLDAFTVYGTQLLLPFSDYPVGWSTLFIIDPLYTLPLVVGVAAAWYGVAKAPQGKAPRWAYRACLAGLVLSSGYVLASVAAKFHVDRVTQAALTQRGIAGAPVFTTPTAFNILLWRIVVMQPEGGPDGYLEGFYSLLDRSGPIEFVSYPSRPALLNDIAGEWAVQRLQWFTKGFYRVREDEQGVVLTDLRMGQEPFYVFSFRVGRRASPKIVPVFAQQVPPDRIDLESLIWIWNRTTRRF